MPDRASHLPRIMKISTQILTVAAFAAFFLSVKTSEGATTNVVVGPASTLVFVPNFVQISQGDSVVWQWVINGQHTTTSGTNGVHVDDNGVPCGLWDSGRLGTTGNTFTNTFTSAGIFYYYCSLHVPEGMTGQVVVASSLAPPTILITNPVPGTVFSAPANVTVQAAVNNGSSGVTNVQFLVNSVVLTNETATPFSAIAANLAAGNYTFTAIALDNNDLSATDSITVSVVTPVPMILSNPLESGAGFQFSYPANIGLDYIVQRSADFATWVTLETNTAVSNPTLFLDANATNGFNFYRIGRLPNP